MGLFTNAANQGHVNEISLDNPNLGLVSTINNGEPTSRVGSHVKTLTRRQVYEAVATHIAGLYLPEVGTIPKTTFKEFAEFLDQDIYLQQKLGDLEASRFVDNGCALELVTYLGKWYYRTAVPVETEYLADTVLTRVTLMPLKTARKSLQKDTNYDATSYRLGDDGFVYISPVGYTMDNRGKGFVKTYQGEEFKTNWREIPVVVQFQMINGSSLEDNCGIYIDQLHRAYVALYTQLGSAKLAWAVNLERLVNSTAAFQKLVNDLAGNNDTLSSVIGISALGGSIGDILEPLSLPQNYVQLVNTCDSLWSAIIKMIKSPDFSTKTGGANVQDKEQISSVINKTNSLDVVKNVRERIWKAMARQWAMVTGVAFPADAKFTIDATKYEDIAGINNENTNEKKKVIGAEKLPAPKEDKTNAVK